MKARDGAWGIPGMGWRFIRRVTPEIADRATPQSIAWGGAAVAIFLIGIMIGLRLEGVAVGISLAAFVVLTPFLVLAGLFYDFQTDSRSVLPTFRNLLTLVLFCWAALEIFALGAYTFSSSNVGRLILLLIMLGAVAFLIFSQFVRLRNTPPVAGANETPASSAPAYYSEDP
jgi:hypothetical protein